MKHEIKRDRILSVFILTILLILTACDVTPDHYEGEPNIYSLLSTDSASVTVQVGLTISVNDTLKVDTIIDTFWYPDSTYDVYEYYSVPWNGMSGAQVTLNQGADVYPLTELADSTGYYRNNDSLTVLAGQSWSMDVKYPTGEEFTATTTIPESIAFLGPDKDTISSTDRLEWNQSTDAVGYGVWAMMWYSYPEDDSVIVDSFSSSAWSQLFPAETTSVPVRDIADPEWFDSLKFFVAALDTNAYDYTFYGRNRWMNLRNDDYMHIEGAWGVFGSHSVTSSKVYSTGM